MDAACAIHFTSFAVEIERAPGPGWKYPGNKKTGDPSRQLDCALDVFLSIAA
jgi:hypothetical protein